jgi:hypothetical protein
VESRQPRQEGLTYLAQETGGFAVLNNNDINLGIQRALKDQQTYYLIGFDPEDEKFDRKYHSIKLKVNRPGLQVRTRAGFIGFADDVRPAAPQTRNAQILSALFSPFGARDLGLQMTSFFFNSPNSGRKIKNDPEAVSFVRSLLHIDASNLTFEDIAEGRKQVRLDVATFTFNENGQVVEHHGRAFELELSDEDYRKALKRGLDYTQDFVVKKPGAYQFRAVIRDAATGRLGSAGQFIQVPDLSKNRLAISGLVLSAQSGDPGAASQSANRAEANDDAQPTPYVRRFSRNGTIVYGAAIYNAALGPKTRKPQLTLQIEFYRDGKVIHRMQPRQIDAGEGFDPKRVNCNGRLRLTDFPTGDYLMRLVVFDSLAKPKYSRAEQWMDFSVR